jgi:hypothetical protein
VILVTKSRRAPAILRDKADAACAAFCVAYDSGMRTFDFDRGLYAHDSVKRALSRAQHGKCCFCESKVTHVAFGDAEYAAMARAFIGKTR